MRCSQQTASLLHRSARLNHCELALLNACPPPSKVRLGHEDVPIMMSHLDSWEVLVTTLHHINSPGFRRSTATKEDIIVQLPNALEDVKRKAWRRSSSGLGSLSVGDLTDPAIESEVLNDLVHKVRRNEFAPSALQRIYLPKKPNLPRRNIGQGQRAHRPLSDGSDTGNYRPIDIPTVQDRIVSRAILLAIAPALDEQFSPFSIGFRSINHPIKQALTTSLGIIEGGFPVVISLDIQKCFDSIDHEYLQRAVLGPALNDPWIKELLCHWLSVKAIGPGKRGNVRTQGVGIPQGLPHSPLLANLTLHALDVVLTNRGIPFIRYADDVTLYSETTDHAQKVFDSTREYLATKLRLTVHPDKSTIVDTHHGDPFELLGLTIRHDDGRFHVDPKPQKRKAFLSTLEAIAQLEDTHERSVRLSSYNAGLHGHYSDLTPESPIWAEWCSILRACETGRWPRSLR